MFGPKLKVERALYERLKRRAAEEGYSSVDEFIRHVLEKAAEGPGYTDDDEEQVKKRLQGLGYIS